MGGGQKRFPSIPQSILLLFKHEREDVVDAVHGVDDDLAAELLRDFFQILLVLGGEDDVADAARQPRRAPFLDAAQRARTRPRRVISPVMQMSPRTVFPVSAEMSAVTSVTPAEGPSLGVAPAGTWIWMSVCSAKSGAMPSSSALARA
mgnify:CR=1 FL=1